MSRQAAIFTAGPPVVAESTGEQVTKEELGGPEVAVGSGLVHAVGDRDAAPPRPECPSPHRPGTGPPRRGRVDIATGRGEIAAAEVVTAGPVLEVRRWAGNPGELDLRGVWTHMMGESARHNGHADLLREAIDGATGD